MCIKSGDGLHLVDAVYKAFADVSYPGDETLLAEDCCDESELANLKSQPWNSNWATVPADIIEWHADSLPHLSAEAFRFYLPAFMVYVLHRPDSQIPVLPFLVYALLNMAEAAMEYGKRRAVDKRRMELLSNEQRSVILDFLAYVRDVLRDPMCLPEAIRAIEALRKRPR